MGLSLINRRLERLNITTNESLNVKYLAPDTGIKLKILLLFFETFKVKKKFIQSDLLFDPQKFLEYTKPSNI